MKRLLLASIGLLLADLWGQAPLSADLALVQHIALPGVEGRIDHLAFDLSSQRLFVAALGTNTVEVVDLRAGVRLRSLPGFREPQGIAVASEGAVVAVAGGESGDLRLLDRADFHAVRTVPLGDDADNVRYEPETGRFYVGYGSGAIGAVRAADGQRLGEVALAGHPESFQLEHPGPRIFVNVPSARSIAVMDRRAMTLMAAWPVIGAESNYPMALDEANHRLFVGCRRPARVLIYDTATGRSVGAADIVGDTDDLFYDLARKRLYVTGGEGFVDVLRQSDPDHLARTAHIPTVAGARTSLYVPSQSRLYLAVPHRGSQGAEIRVYEARD